MAIFLGLPPEEQFTRVPNAWARDPKLSFKAKGLMTYLLSHEDGYRLTVEQVIAETRDGKSAVYAGLKELMDCGYLRRTQDRLPGGKVAEVHYFVADAPAQTASRLTASRKPESGDDQQEHEESPGQTASRFSASRLTASGKSTTKKTRVKKTKTQEDQNTTSPNPSDDLAVVEAEIVEEGDGLTSSLEDQIQRLIDEAVALKPNWRKLRSEIRTQIDGSLRAFGSFEAVSVIVRETAKDPTSAHPTRITASGNPAVVAANLALTVTRLNSQPASGRALYPNAHPFDADTSGISCKRCGTSKINGMHRASNEGGRHKPYRDPADLSEYDKPFYPDPAA